jgi:hypothetical protein
MRRRYFRDARSDIRVFSLSQSIISAYRQEVQLTVLGAGDETARRVDCRQALHRRPRAIRRTLTTVCQVPDTYRFVDAAGNRQASIRGDRNTFDPLVVSGQDHPFLPSSEIPQPHRTIVTGTDRPVAIRCDRHVGNPAGMPAQHM